MTRWFLVLVVVLAAGCNKPEESDCRKAIRNMQRLLGTDKLDPQSQNIEGAVRKCRGASKKESVECAIQAQTLQQLMACPFAKEMKLAPIDGSGSAGSGSAGSGSAGSGSALVPPQPAPGSGAAVPAPTPLPPGSGSSGSAAPAAGSGAGSGS